MSVLPLLEVAFSNIAVAAALAAVAAVLGRVADRPALVHGLCLLALLKLVTPPFCTVGILPEPPAAAAAPAPPSSAQRPARTRVADARRIPDGLLADPAAARSQQAPASARLVGSQTVAAARIPWPTLLLLAWLCGSLAVAFHLLIRSRRFVELLRHARPAPPELRAEARQLAARIGLRRIPELQLLPARVSPMLCPAAGRLRLLLPERLCQDLAPDGRRALLLHELAHVRRRDHWTRRVEMLVTVVYWWLPIVWWLRRQLREAEEQCCDAWVVWAMPERGRTYADALLDTVDFLAGARVALPPQACGAGHVHHLQRRLTNIMRAKTQRNLTRGSRLAVLALAALTLPVLPTRAQKPTDRQESTDARLEQALQRIEQLEKIVLKLQDRTRRDAAQDETARDPGTTEKWRPGQNPGWRETRKPQYEPIAREQREVEEVEATEEVAVEEPVEEEAVEEEEEVEAEGEEPRATTGSNPRDWPRNAIRDYLLRQHHADATRSGDYDRALRWYREALQGRAAGEPGDREADPVVRWAKILGSATGNAEVVDRLKAEIEVREHRIDELERALADVQEQLDQLKADLRKNKRRDSAPR